MNLNKRNHKKKDYLEISLNGKEENLFEEMENSLYILGVIMRDRKNGIVDGQLKTFLEGYAETIELILKRQQERIKE